MKQLTITIQDFEIALIEYYNRSLWQKIKDLFRPYDGVNITTSVACKQILDHSSEEEKE